MPDIGSNVEPARSYPRVRAVRLASAIATGAGEDETWPFGL